MLVRSSAHFCIVGFSSLLTIAVDHFKPTKYVVSWLRKGRHSDTDKATHSQPPAKAEHRVMMFSDDWLTECLLLTGSKMVLCFVFFRSHSKAGCARTILGVWTKKHKTQHHLTACQEHCQWCVLRLRFHVVRTAAAYSYCYILSLWDACFTF